MKRNFAKIITALLLCRTLAPMSVAADLPLISTKNQPAYVISRGRGGIKPDNRVTASAITLTPSAITLTHFDKSDPPEAKALATGTSQEELSDLFSCIPTYFIGRDASGNESDPLRGIWSWDAVDTSRPGLYYATASPDLGETYSLADGLALPQQLYVISIQTPGKLEINYLFAGRGFLHFPWVFSQEQSDYLKQLEQSSQQSTFANLWLQKNDEKWIQLKDGNFIFVSDGLQINQSLFEINSTYNLQVDYPGGQTDVLTFQYNEEISSIHYAQGDRDGGDVNGSGSPTGSQPAPTPPQTATSYQANDLDNASTGSNETPLEAIFHDPVYLTLDFPWDQVQLEETFSSDQPAAIIPAELKRPVSITPVESTTEYSAISSSDRSDKLSPVAAAKSPGESTQKAGEEVVINPTQIKTTPPVVESYSPEETVISRLRLLDLCSEGDNVLFGSGDLTVRLPSKLLLELDLSDFDTLSVKLSQPKNNQITLALAISGKPITKFSQAFLQLRYTPQYKHSEITVQDELNQAISNATFDNEFLYFTANNLGTYTISELSKSNELQKNTFPLLPLSIGLILLAGGIIFFRWKRHG